MPLASIGSGQYEQDFECDTQFFKNMENADIISSDVKVHLDVEKKHDAFDCTFTFKGQVQIPCDRCLDPMDHDVDTVYHIIVKYGDSYNDESDDVLIIPDSDRYLNVAYMLADSILLTIPIRHVHPAGKCNKAMAAALNRHNSPIDGDGDEEIDEDFDDNENED